MWLNWGINDIYLLDNELVCIFIIWLFLGYKLGFYREWDEVLKWNADDADGL